MTPALRRTEPRIGALGVAALASAVVAMLMLAWGAWRLGSAAISASAAASPVEMGDLRGPDLATAQARIDGRSLFFIPSAPPPPPPPPRAESDEPSAPPPPPPPPSRYGGPGVIALINDTVWFEGGQRLAPGESGGGVRVIAVDAPWSARVHWEGVEFDVALFPHDEVVYPGGISFRGDGASDAPDAPSPGEAELEPVGDATGAAPGSDQHEESQRADRGADAEGTSR